MVDRTPCTIPVKSSGFRPSAAAAAAPGAEGAVGGAVGAEAGGCPDAGGWEKIGWEAYQKQ